jgi:nicotinamidase-related amidase
MMFIRKSNNKLRRGTFVPLLALLLVQLSCAVAKEVGPEKTRPALLEFDLQRRDPQSGKPVITREKVDPRKVGMVVIDMWNDYICPTGTELFGGSLVPRMNRVFAGARALGITVIHAPTDAADFYVGWPQAEKVAALPRYEIPKVRELGLPGFPGPVKACLCGPGILCPYMHSWDGINPNLHIAEEDYILLGPVYGDSGTQRLHAICRDRGITHLIYCGVATNICVVGKAPGAMYMGRAGLNIILARDLTEAVIQYDPETGYTPDDGTTQSVAAIEKDFCPSIDMGSELKRVGLWADDPVDPVHLFPHWSIPDQPYTFEESFVQTITTPRIEGDNIHYTLDGSLPTEKSPLYSKPIRITGTGVLRALSFKNGKPAALESKSHHVKIIPLPPMPDVHLSDLTPVRATAPEYLDGHTSEGVAPNIRFDQSFVETPLRIRGTTYEKGMGVHAPSQLLYELKPEYERFVAIAGIDDQILRHDSGMHVAHHPSVVFRVFVDGRQVAESPTIRTYRHWRFNLPIPAGSKLISLVAMDAGNGRFKDIADWVNAGFTLKQD